MRRRTRSRLIIIRPRSALPASETVIAFAAALWMCAGSAAATQADPPPQPTPTPAATGELHVHGDRKEESPKGSRNLFQSDMNLMTGMTPRDPMGGMAMPGWRLMDMGVVRLQFNRQGGPSGKETFESTNWNMVHVEHDLWGGRFSFMLMNSLEPETLSRFGTPQLFQLGETLDRKPLVDTQHPHDFFMNLSATYRHPLGAEGAFWLQYAPVGDPALGPGAFMHRASSGENPSVPLSHHGHDSTHITFGVVTAGAGWRWISIEGSAFHGAEPDENRWNFDSQELDSASGRLKLSPGRGWSAQVSQGSIHDPDLLFPGVVHRTTASISYGAEGDRPLAFMLAWGRDRDSGNGEPSVGIGQGARPFAVRHPNAPRGYTDYWLLEGAYQATERDHLYGRGEYVDRNLQLLFTKRGALPGQPIGTTIVRIKALTVGYLRDFDLVKGLKTGIGADLTAYKFPSFLNDVYGSRPLSTHIYLRLRWGKPHGADHVM